MILRGRQAPPARDAERLEKLYDEWGKPAEAARWRKELQAAKAAAAAEKLERKPA